MDLSNYKEGVDGLTDVQTQISFPEQQQVAPAEQSAKPSTPPAPAKEAGGLEGIGKFVEEKFGIPGADLIDNLFGGDKKTADQIAGERKQARAEGEKRYDEIDAGVEQAAYSNPVSAAGTEAIRAGIGGLAGAAESAGEFLDLSGDSIKTFLGMASEEDNVLSDKYQAAEFNLGVAENQTPAGAFAREMVSILVLMRGASRVPGLGAKSTKLGRLGTEAVRGAIADLISDPDSGNLGNLLEEMAPGLKGTWVTALAQDEGDNPWEKRLKNVIEGGVFGTAIDGITEVISAIRAGRAVMKAGGSVDDAVDTAIGIAQRTDTPQRPGVDVREAEALANDASPNRPSLFEPNERAARTTSFDPMEAVRSQVRAEEFDGVGRVGASPILTDDGYRKILGTRNANYEPGSVRDLEGKTETALQALRGIIGDVGRGLDVDQLARDLGQPWEETTAKALVAVRNFLGDNTSYEKVVADELMAKDPLRAFEGITFKDDKGNVIGNREAVVAVKTLVRDTAMQIDELAENAGQVIAAGGDATRQADMLVDRLAGLLRLHKVSSVHYASGLNAFRIGSITIGNSGTALAKQLGQLDDALENLRNLVHAGDPESLQEFRHLVAGMALSGGDPGKQLGFWANAWKYGTREALTGMINSMLSGPLTQTRNIVGNAFAVGLRPLAMSMGYRLSGNQDAARAALGSFHSFGESLGEAFDMFGKSWQADHAIHEGVKFDHSTTELAEQIDLLGKQASTPAQQGAAWTIGMMHSVFSSPWATLPTRGLTAADDAFKTLIARMEIKREVFEEAMQDGHGFKFDADLYAKKLTDKLGTNGAIADPRLLSVAKEATFQTELHGFMGQLSALSETSPLMKYFLPFIRTPHNLFVYGGTHVPGLNRFFTEYKTVMAGDDESLKAVMKGREAIGYMAVTSGVGLAATGMITGNGPVDPEQRKIWLQSHQPQSFRVGDGWVSYAALEPINLIFSASADLVEIAKAGDFAGYEKSFGQLAYTIANAVYQRQYFKGLGSALSMVNPKELSNGSLIEKTGAEMLNNLIPYAGARRQLSKALAPGMFEYTNEQQRVLAAAIPGYNNFFGAEKIDIFTGKQMGGPGSAAGHLVNQLLPFNISAGKGDEVIEKLSEIGMDITIEYGETLRGIKLPPEHRNEINKRIAESGLHGNLKKLFNSKAWNADFDRWNAARRLGNAPLPKDTLWYAMVANEFEGAKMSAVNSYARQNIQFGYLYRQTKAQQARAGRGAYKKFAAGANDLADMELK